MKSKSASRYNILNNLALKDANEEKFNQIIQCLTKLTRKKIRGEIIQKRVAT